MKKTNRHLLKYQKNEIGQGMTEYLIIVALIAVSAVLVYRLLGSTIQHKTAAIAQLIAEEDSSSAETKAKKDANEAASVAGKR